MTQTGGEAGRREAPPGPGRLRRFRVPHTLALLFGMIVLAWLVTLALPAGRFDRAENEHGRMQVVPGTFQFTPDVAAPSPLAIFTAVPRGMEAAAEIIFFVFIIGGAFAVLRATGAIDALLGAALRRFAHRPMLLVIGGVILFAAGASTIGMSEEYLPFVPLLVTLAIALGYDAVVGVAIITVGYGVGYGVAAINPFTVIIAQEIAGLPPTSGLGFRLAISAIFLPLGIHHVWRYAARIKEDPSRSLVADFPPPEIERPHETPAMTATHKLVLGIAFAMIVVLVYGLARLGWYMVEMARSSSGWRWWSRSSRECRWTARRACSARARRS